MRILAGLLAAGISAGTAFAVQAQETTAPVGPYVGGQAGVNWARDRDYTRAGASVSPDYEMGPALSGHLGYNFGQVGPVGLRTEGEVAWRRNSLDDLNGRDANGRLTSLGLFGNVLVDIPTGTALTPFVGAGLGAVQVNASDISARGFRNLDDSEWKLGYQGIAGMSYALTEQLALRGDYRYMATTTPTFTADNGNSVKVPTGNHTLMVGLTWHFGQPAPKPQPIPAAAPAPAPAPQPAPAPVAAQPSSYMVFFDWDRADLTDEARTIIGRAVAAARQGQKVRIDLTGHADRSGTDAYNLKLSQRRADAVRAAMVQQGLPMDAISTVARGESDPLVQTPDGVREPQNRRVEILLP
ncbi:OmpA family protein [Novispirillum sp. DQ9]|uniref:OmpA family protein n=1 Tax=Novispirillum sp. DQ9 TaxID=3398612 RepID=UPI003C7BDBEC